VRSFGRYRLVEHLASGGMADVWRAETTGPEGFVKEVALKLVRGEHRGDDAFVRMFVREARLAARLHHANVVQVFDFDAIDGQYYLAMELVRGRTLRAVLDRCREQGVRFGVARAVHVATEVARALAHAHGLEEGGHPAGLVHRDVSPQNVLVSHEGEVKLADFGIARAAGAESTRAGVIQGKLAYMAPEQARGEPVDARADVFALGVVLWEACTGRRLFARDSDAATLAAVIGDEPVSRPSEWNEEAPPELDDVVLGALRRDPAERIATADELLARLAALRLRLARSAEDLDLRGLMRRLWPEGGSGGHRVPEPTLVRPGPAQAPPALATTVRTEVSTRTAVAPRRGPKGLLVALGALATLVVAGGVVVGRRGEGRATPTPTAPPTSTATPTAIPTPTAGPPSPAGPPPRPAELTVNAVPWATITVDGEPRGDTPLVLELPPGRHRIRAAHPRAGAVEEDVDLAPGERRAWRAPLAR
jgi:serine/threonine protein kinase